MAVGQPVSVRRRAVHRSGGRGHRREYRVRRDDLSVDAESAAGARPRSADGGSGVSGPVHRCGTGRPAFGTAGRQVPAGARHGFRLRGCCPVAGSARGVARLGSLPNRFDRMRFHDGPGVRVHHRRNPGGGAARARGRGGRRGADVIGDAGRRRCRGVRHDARGVATEPECRRAAGSTSSSWQSPPLCCLPPSRCWLSASPHKMPKSTKWPDQLARESRKRRWTAAPVGGPAPALSFVGLNSSSHIRQPVVLVLPFPLPVLVFVLEVLLE